MTDTHIPNFQQYRSTLNRMGCSMILFIPLFYLFTMISELGSLYCLGTAWPTPAGTAIATASYGILAVICYMAPFFLTGGFYYLLSRRTVTERVDLSVRLPKEFPLLILAGLAILSASAYLNADFCDWIGYSIPEELIQMENYDDPAIVILYMTVALAPAFAEEFLFRGVFYANLRPYGRTQAILISALLFALMHENIAQMFYTFVAGIAMALMYEITGSIWCSVFFHMINNELSVIKEVLYYGSFGEAAAPYLTILDGIVLILGAVSLFLLIRYYAGLRSGNGSTDGSSWLSKDQSRTIARYDAAVSPSSVCKSLLNPGMIVFTAVTVFLMLITWLELILIRIGGM